MSSYEYVLRSRAHTIAELDEEIDLLRFRCQETWDRATRKLCEEKLATCARLRADRLQLSLFPEVSA